MQRRAIIVDDDPAVWEMLREVLVEDGRYRLVAAVTDGELALALAERAAPDLVLMDLHLPGIGGLETARRLLARQPTASVVVVSAHVGDTDEYRRATQAAGIRACIPKAHFSVTTLRQSLS